jgi:hypothetical protein
VTGRVATARCSGSAPIISSMMWAVSLPAMETVSTTFPLRITVAVSAI